LKDVQQIVTEAIEDGNQANFPNLEDFEEELNKRRDEKQRLRRGRGANRKDRELVDAVAREKGMNKTQRQQFGDYIEKIKRQEGRGGADNFTRNELLDLAEEFLSI